MILDVPDRSESPRALRRFFVLLGLCPLLPAAVSVAAALGLGVALVVVLAGATILVAPLRRHLPDAVQSMLLVMLMGMLAAAADLLLQAFVRPWHLEMHLALPLVVGSAFLLSLGAEQEPGAMRFSVARLRIGAGAALLLLATGGVRELLGKAGVQLGLVAPGAFFVAAGLCALLQLWGHRHDTSSQQSVAPGSRRVRVTGKI